MTGIIVAFLFGSIAAPALFGHGLSVLVWKRSRGWAAAGILVLGFAAIVNVSNSLDAVIGRNAKTYSELAAAKQTRANQEAEKTRLDTRRAKIDTQGYVTTSAEQAQAATDAVTAAATATKAECGDGGIHRGKECRRLEGVEATKRTEQGRVLANRALTLEIERIDKRLGELAIELAKPIGITDANTTQQGGAMALARLFRLPTTWGELLADWKMLVLSAILDLVVMLSYVYYEVLGWQTREERKQSKEAPPTTSASTEEATIEPPPKPRLVASQADPPPVSLIKFAGQALRRVKRKVLLDEIDFYWAYWQHCELNKGRALTPKEAIGPIDHLCRDCKIPIKVVGTKRYLVGVELVNKEQRAHAIEEAQP